MAEEWYTWDYNTKTYLHNKILQFKNFSSVNHAHDHCELCWARFSDLHRDIHSGYYEKESKSWICNDCYAKLKDIFGWTEARGD